MSQYHVNIMNLDTKVSDNLPYPFPFKTTLSLKPLIDFWKVALNEHKEDTTRQLIKKIISDRISSNSTLLEPITDYQVLEEHAGLIDLLLQVIFPPALRKSQLNTAIVPYTKKILFSSPLLEKILGENLNKLQFDESAFEFKLRHAYTSILQKCYGVDISVDHPMIIPLPDEQTGLLRYYKGDFNADFVEVKPIGALKPLQENEIDYLINHLDNLDVWKDYLPFDSFEFQGFAVFSLTDISDQEVISTLKYLLLNNNAIKDSQNFEQLQLQTRTLFNLPDIQLGISVFNPKFKRFVFLGDHSSNSLLLHNQEGTVCPYHIGAGTLFEKLYQQGKPLIMPDLMDMEITKNLPASIRQQLLAQNINNIVVAPLTCEGQFIGLLEIASPNVNDLNNTHLLKINELLPLFSIAVERSLDDMESQIQGIIKEECTAIHPSVEWRFTEAALRFLDKQSKGEGVEMEAIVFEDVYPLYGASDVRSSSTKRNAAIQSDLIEHLTLARNVLENASTYQMLPIFDELTFKINKHIAGIEKSLSSGDEMAVFDFLKREIEPLFEDFETNNNELLSNATNAYQSAIDSQLGVLYHKRKAFEDSLTKINEEISIYIEAQQDKAQAMFPHYFEKYRTDGVEYNIYIGASLVNDRTFRHIYLKNLRLWQLMTTCEVARIAENLRHELPLSLETTHLILVHSTPMAIRFRADEKQFDVDGAYNIRYEIIKKRIDKAYIRGTEERLTQPRKIAIVYSQAKEAYEYLEYIEYLKSIDYITDNVEELELELLQGVRGLKALRVTVNI